MRLRRFALLAAGTVIAAGAAVGGSRAAPAQDQPTVTVYKSPT